MMARLINCTAAKHQDATLTITFACRYLWLAHPMGCVLEITVISCRNLQVCKVCILDD